MRNPGGRANSHALPSPRPEDAWAGSATTNDGELSAVNSFTFYLNQLPGPMATQHAVHKKFR